MSAALLLRLGLPLAALALPACAGAAPQNEQRTSKAGALNAAAETVAARPAATIAAVPAAGSAEAQPAGVSATAKPDAGSRQRAAIMDALRPAIERKLAGPVEFVVKRIGVQDGWALVIADPQRPGGGRIDPKRHFPNEVVEFMDGLTVNAILRFSGRGWTLVDHAIGPTDVWYCGVEGPPRALTGC